MEEIREVYLDNSATTKVAKEAVDAMVQAMTLAFGNPSSLHRKGMEAERIVSKSRETLAAFLGAKSREIYFTSGGTESNNLAIKGAAYARKRYGRHLITTAIEHPSVLDVFKSLEEEGFSVTYLGVDDSGHINLEELERALKPDTILVSIMYVNNEVGSIQPIEAAAEIIAKNKNTLFHVDAVQAFGKIPLIPHLKGIHLMSLSAHKIYGPKGVGALYVRDGIKIMPLFNGGGQEEGLRSGTENVPGIAGFSAASELAFKNMAAWQARMRELKERLKDRILEEIPDAVLNGSENGAPHILNISFLGTRAEVLLHALESHGIYVSTGSACSSYKKGKSHVLAAMGKTAEEIDSALRFSFSPFLSLEDIDYTVEILKKEVTELRKFIRR
ncbi:cysteine desulfurase family protein [Thermosediminibacter oceani]|uniref:Aminotransferase class V n=1 Tax=Thermosediminibacter oceani (strain ATCC BAA-1034 / DSM 16646 / JW/IW-1228P) TaxID=555079 RepID=D9RXZ2_THEOJ|nr:cysteine desulfurase family protein [Thermosediminibacter oceani]ADL08216.1 aminotransferase class V [Thermosediminibacter oceani DSM 16646]